MKLKATATLEFDTTLNVTPVGENHSHVRVTYETATVAYKSLDKLRKPRSYQKNRIQHLQGVISNKDLTSFTNGGVLKIDYEVKMMSQEVLDYFNTTHYTKAWEHMGDEPSGDVPVKMDINAHMLFDLDGVPYPVALYYDYINASMDNGKYALNSVLKHLLTRDDIRFLDDPEVRNIPYYNITEDHSKYLEFFWMPKREDYIKMWDWCLANGGEYPSTSRFYAVEALDLLGINKYKIV
jgi:hypothetical protein